jgi:hypothetical protein
MLWKTQQEPGRVSNPVNPPTNLEGVHEPCHFHISHRNGVSAVRRRAVWCSYYGVISITVSGTL